MILLPAIDMIGGQAVRLRQGDYTKQSDYGDPLALACSYKEAGATFLHVVDLDAARTATPHPRTPMIIADIVRETGLQVELGGGIRTALQVQEWLSLGVWRCVLGTAAIKDHGFAREMAARFGARVVIGIDARAGLVATSGWLETQDMRAVDVACAMKELGFTDCVYTDISKDGMLSGANVEASAKLAEASGLRVIVSGGVRDLEDIKAAQACRHRGVAGVIAGKSVVEGTLDLAEAIAFMSRSEDSRGDV